MAEKTSWGDNDTSKEFGTDIERYKGRKKMKDIIRIVSDPIKYYTHTVNKTFGNCSKLVGRCLLCESGYDRAIKVGCLVVHIAEKDADKAKAKYKEVGEVKIWLFGKDKWFSINGIIDDYPKIKSEGLNKQDLIVTCEDDKFQKLEIRPTLSKSTATKEMMDGYKAALKKLKEWYTSPMEMEKQKELVQGSSYDPEAGDANEDFESKKDKKSAPEEGGESEGMSIDERMEQIEEGADKPETEGLGDLLDEIVDDGGFDDPGAVPF